MVGRVARMGLLRISYKMLVRRLERKRPPVKPRCGWEDNTKMDHNKIEWESVKWVHMQYRDQ